MRSEMSKAAWEHNEIEYTREEIEKIHNRFLKMKEEYDSVGGQGRGSEYPDFGDARFGGMGIMSAKREREYIERMVKWYEKILKGWPEEAKYVLTYSTDAWEYFSPEGNSVKTGSIYD